MNSCETFWLMKTKVFVYSLYRNNKKMNEQKMKVENKPWHFEYFFISDEYTKTHVFPFRFMFLYRQIGKIRITCDTEKWRRHNLIKMSTLTVAILSHAVNCSPFKFNLSHKWHSVSQRARMCSFVNIVVRLNADGMRTIKNLYFQAFNHILMLKLWLMDRASSYR